MLTIRSFLVSGCQNRYPIQVVYAATERESTFTREVSLEFRWMDAPVVDRQTTFMAKRKPEIRMRTYGIYSQWDSASKTLPKIAEVTTRVHAVVDVEFGFVVNVKGAKNQELFYCIDHPGILDASGETRAPFDGVVYVKTNDWDFYLGDTIWDPIEDKLGEWRMFLELSGKIVAEKAFELYS